MMMTTEPISFAEKAQIYLSMLHQSFTAEHYGVIEILAQSLRKAWVTNRRVFICGNGGSAANALHISMTYYGIGSWSTKNSWIKG